MLTAATVTNLQDGQYGTDGRAYLGMKRDARYILPALRRPTGSSADRLNELKTMRDRGLITEEEYQARPTASWSADATAPEPSGYLVTVACPCGVVLERWVAELDAATDLPQQGLRATWN